MDDNLCDTVRRYRMTLDKAWSSWRSVYLIDGVKQSQVSRLGIMDREPAYQHNLLPGCDVR